MKFAITFTVFLAVTVHFAAAQWSTDPNVNTAISTGTGGEYYPVIVTDGAGGAIISWLDNRPPSTSLDVYAQHIDASGVVKWTADGVAICTAEGDQESATIISDGAGGAIITWQDYRGSATSSDIYAQHIDASGVVQWTANGAAICTGVNSWCPQIVSDGAHGAIITWFDLRGAHWNIYAQRINAAGVVQWTANGVAISTDANSLYPTITSDGAGGAIITWYEPRESQWDVYAQRIDAAGHVQWEANGVTISTGSKMDPLYPTIVSDGAHGAIITWQDYRSGTDWDIYAQRINASGVVQWEANGAAISTAATAPNNQMYPKIVGDGLGGAIITWQDYRSGTDWDIYAQYINAAGLVQWTAGGTAISLATNDQTYDEESHCGCSIVSDGAGGAIITWHDHRSGSNWDIYAQRIDASGSVRWTTNGVPISTQATNQRYPTIVSGGGGGGAIITWEDLRNGYFDIYAQCVDINGMLCGTSPQQFSCDSLHVYLAQVGDSCCWDMILTNPYSGLYGVKLTGLEQTEIASVTVPSGWQSIPSPPSSVLTFTMANGTPITVGQTTIHFCIASGGSHTLAVDWLNDSMSVVCSDTVTASCTVDTNPRGTAFNKDFQNNTGQTANDIEITLEGDQQITHTFDNNGFVPPLVYGTFRYSRRVTTLDGQTVTVLRWDTVSVPPGGSVHIGFWTDNTSVTIKSMCWTKDSVSIGPITQVTIKPEWTDTVGIILTNNVNDCNQQSIGTVSFKVDAIEFYGNAQPLDSLNNHAIRVPIRRDTSGFAPFILPSGASDTLRSVDPPANAGYIVWIIDIDTDPGMASPALVRDFVQFSSRFKARSSMARGWNMVSVPVNAEDHRLGTLFPSAISHAFGYEGMYVQYVDTIWPGKGYWLKLASAQPITMSGYEITTLTVPVIDGWNMIGSISVPVPVSNITSDPPGIVTSVLYGYEHGYAIYDTVIPGKGYWIKTNIAGKLILSSSPSLMPSDRIRIVPTTELPPPPPGGGSTEQRTLQIPAQFALEQNYPNPFNPVTVIQYSLPEESYVKLKVYNVLGQEVLKLVDRIENSGYKSVEFDASVMPSGLYFYRLEATSTSDPGKSFSQVRKMILMK